METIGAARNVFLVLVVVAVLGGTTFAAARALDGGTEISEIRAKRAKQEAVAARKERKAEKRQLGAAAAPVAGGSRSRRRWAPRANALCDRTYDEILRLVERSPTAGPQDILRLLDASLLVTDRFIVRLEALGPAPNRRVHAQLMRELHASQAADRRAVRALEVRWSSGALAAALQESAQRSESLRSLAERLDAVACSQLFDPIAFG
ncbi:MAG TPA: hypothetical protein VFM13_00575 [Gaiellaceae bacterium]|nr:hypothetical protein [Gaiellaceae bacterium]